MFDAVLGHKLFKRGVAKIENDGVEVAGSWKWGMMLSPLCGQVSETSIYKYISTCVVSLE